MDILDAEISKDTVCAQVLLELEAGQDLSVVVEGDVDSRVLSSFFCSSVSLIVGVGKENVLGATRLVLSGGEVRVVGVVDRDLDTEAPSEEIRDNLVFWDFHDLEVAVFESKALEKFLKEYASKEKIGKYSVSEIRSEVYDAVVPISKLRILSKNWGWNFSFKRLLDHRWNFLNRDLEFDEVSFIRSILASSGSMNLFELVSERMASEEVPLDPPEVCNGHHVSHVLGIGMRKRYASLPVSQSERREIESKLRLAFSGEHFFELNIAYELGLFAANHGVDIFNRR